MQEQASPWSSWIRHHRINAYVLDHIPEVWLSDQHESSDKFVGMYFAEMHKIRLLWLQVGAPDIWNQMPSLDRKKITYRLHLKSHLQASTEGIHQLLKLSHQQGKIKGFKASTSEFMSYLISYESHWRAQALFILQLNQRELPEELISGMWDWGKR